jgi:hypothetical protein
MSGKYSCRLLRKAIIREIESRRRHHNRTFFECNMPVALMGESLCLLNMYSLHGSAVSSITPPPILVERLTGMVHGPVWPCLN